MSQELSANATLSHYRIVSKIGAGGMGEVWLAEDTRLKRKVALKLLPAGLTSDAERVRRFEQEAQAASALNHPNIITVYDVGESEAGRFIVMELVGGRTLRSIISENISMERFLSVGIQMAKALSAAHGAGITHRDIKPDNIMVREDGYVKVLDFGLARLLPSGSAEDAATLAQQTTPGMIMGTLAYMSPEQASGERAGPASDVFTLGIVLYELATGKHPFQADTMVGYLHAITLQTPAPVTHWKPELPTALDTLVLRMLEKDASRRPAASEVAQALQELDRHSSSAIRDDEQERIGSPLLEEAQTRVESRVDTSQPIPLGTGAARARTGRLISTIGRHKRSLAVILAAVGVVGYWFFNPRSASEAIDSLAVLPFQNRSANADSEYLSEGLAESLIYRLSQLPNLRVSPTTSVSRYRGQDTDLVKIGNELGVQAVMTGRIAQRGESLVISVELVDVRNNKTLWGEMYERKLADLLAIQREMASEITQRLRLRLSGEGEEKLAKRYTDNNEAYQLYLRGRYHFSRRTKEDDKKSIDYLEEAISLDPRFALAYAGIAESWATMPLYPYLSPTEAASHAKKAVAKALELDPELAEAHTIAGYIASSYDWNWAEAEREFKRAIELNPNLANAHYRYAWTYLAPLGRHEEAIAEMKRAMELEPLNLIQGAHFAAVYMYARQFDAALEQARKTHDLDPTFVIGKSWLCFVLNARGMYAETLEISEKSQQADSLLLPQETYAYAKTGRRQQAEAVINTWRQAERSEYVLNYWIAVAYAALGETDAAFAELEKAYQSRDFFFHRLKVDPFIDPLRDDPRFKEMLQRLNLPE